LRALIRYSPDLQNLQVPKVAMSQGADPAGPLVSTSESAEKTAKNRGFFAIGVSFELDGL
jgi:hypothetical protein